MPRKKDPYQVDRNFLPNPATALYKVEEGVISKLPWIEELVDTARYLEERIAGDFDKIDSFIAQIHENNFGFVRTGLIAYKLKYFKAYKKIAKTFKRFCEDHLHKSHWMINRLIVAAKVVIDLIAAGFDQLPKNEAQCRSLLAGCEDDLASAWQFVLDAHEGELHKDYRQKHN